MDQWPRTMKNDIFDILTHLSDKLDELFLEFCFNRSQEPITTSLHPLFNHPDDRLKYISLFARLNVSFIKAYRLTFISLISWKILSPAASRNLEPTALKAFKIPRIPWILLIALITFLTVLLMKLNKKLLIPYLEVIRSWSSRVSLWYACLKLRRNLTITSPNGNPCDVVVRVWISSSWRDEKGFR